MEQFEDKYKNDKYDRSLYIPKGYILPDGSQLTKSYARLHEDMAKRFIEENYKYTFTNDIIKDPKDFMLMRVGALQVMSCGLPILLHCDEKLSNEIEAAIVSYLSYDWKEIIIENPYSNYFNYMRYRLFEGTGLSIGDDKYEEKIANQKILKRR